MFFYLAKFVYFFIAPSHFLIFCGLTGLLASIFGFVRIARVLIVFSIVGMAVVAFTPVSLLIALPLEERFQPPDPVPARVDGIIVLGGSVNTNISAYNNRLSLTDSGERIADTAGLASRFPDARIVYTGGSSAFFNKTVTEAEIGERYLLSFGISKDRLIIEDKAQNTWQNATLSKALAKPVEGETWLLVTSAFHMPRSVGIFRKVGWPGIVPWPVDYRVGGVPDTKRFRSNAGLSIRLLDTVVKEWVGLVAYYLTGRTSALYPAP